VCTIESESLKTHLPILQVLVGTRGPSLIHILDDCAGSRDPADSDPFSAGLAGAKKLLEAMTRYHKRPCALLDVYALRWLFTPDIISALCRLRSSSEQGHRFCVFSDLAATLKAYETGGPGLYQCRSLGVLDYVVPIKANIGHSETVVAAFIGGQYQQTWPFHAPRGRRGLPSHPGIGGAVGRRLPAALGKSYNRVVSRSSFLRSGSRSKVVMPDGTLRWRLKPELVMPPYGNLGFIGALSQPSSPAGQQLPDYVPNPGVDAVCEFAWRLDRAHDAATEILRCLPGSGGTLGTGGIRVVSI